MYPEDFEVPLVEDQNKGFPEPVASNQAFYAAGSYSQDPISDYGKIFEELRKTGNSELFESAKNRWIQEQDFQTKSALPGLIADPNVDYQTKKSIVTQYALGGLISTDIKDKYIEKVSETPFRDSVIDLEDQEKHKASIGRLRAALEMENTKIAEQEGESWFWASLKGAGFAAADIGQGVIAGLGGAVYAIKEWDAVKGQAFMLDLVKKWRLDPNTNKAEDVRNGITETLGVLGVPAEKVSEYVTELTGSASTGIVTSVVADPAAVIGAPIVAGAYKGIRNGIKRRSVLHNTAAANPKAAEDLVRAALEDPTEVTARAMGTSKSEILSDVALPSLNEVPDLNLMPDFSAELIEGDRDYTSVYDRQRFDENVQTDAETRRKDLEIVQDTIARTLPYYHQNKSSIQNIEGNVYEGFAIYGKDNARFFSTKQEIAEFYPVLKEAIGNAKDELRSDLTVIDLSTRIKYDTLKDVPENGVFAFEWRWKKEYDDVAALFFEPDSITSSISLGPKWLGLSNIDVSGIAKSSANWWWLNIGTMPKWVELATSRAAPRRAKMDSILFRDIQKYVVGTKFPKELQTLIERAEVQHKDWFSTQEISTLFTYLQDKDVQDVFKAYTALRRTDQRLHSLVNLNKRNELIKNGFTRELVLDDKYAGMPINENWKFKSKKEAEDQAEYVWDFDLNARVLFQLNESRLKEPGSYDIGGKRLVQFANPFNDPANPTRAYEFALVGGKRARSEILSQRVVPRVPGHFPLKTDENFFITATPVYRNINGRDVWGYDEAGAARLANYSQTIAAARNKVEAEKIIKNLKKHNATLTIEQQVNYSINRDRSVSFNSLEKELEARSQINRAAQKRGDTLYNSYGKARQEDRLITLVNTIRSMTNQNSMRVFDEGFQATFERSYSEFLPDGKFPLRESDIQYKGVKPSLETEERVAEARALFRRYARLNSYGTWLDASFQRVFHSIADITDKFRNLSDFLRKAGNKGDFVTTALRVFTSTLFINLYPQRQWLVQTSTLLDIVAMQALGKDKAFSVFQDTLAVRFALMAEGNLLNNTKYGALARYTRETAQKMSSMSKKEFDDTLDAIKMSGLMESIDLNMLVHGVIKDLDTPLVESQVASYAKAVPRGVQQVSRFSRSVGFDAAEFTNRLGLWLAAKEIWKQKNPDADWNTIRNIEEISYEEFRLSGSMSRAGAYAYQEGFPSVFMQFAAITQKMLMNVIQDNATILSPDQRARLAAARLIMYGPRFGLPIGRMMNHFLNSVDDEESRELLRLAERGMIDHMVNGLIYIVTGKAGDLNISANLSTYSEYGLPQIETLFEFWKIFDDKPSNPRFPAIGAIGAVEQIGSLWKSWWRADEFTLENANKILYESLSFASGMGAVGRAVLMYELGDKFTKAGVPLGMKSTAFEAIAQVFGVGTFREEDLYEAAVYMGDYDRIIKNTAKDMHEAFVKLYNTSDEESFMTSAKYLGSYMSALKGSKFWGDPELDALQKQFWELEKQQEKSLKASVTMKLFNKARNKNNDDAQRSWNTLTNTLPEEKRKELNEILNLMRGDLSNGTNP